MAKKKYPNIQWREGVAQLEVVIKGERIRESLHTSNLAEAIERRDKRMAEIKKGATDESLEWTTPGTSRPTVTWEQMREYDMNRARLVSSERVVETTIGYFWKRLRPFFPDAHSISNDALGTYARHQLAAGMSSVTIKRDMYAAMRGYEWAREQLPELPLFKKTIKMAATPPGKKEGEFIEPGALVAILERLKPLPAAKLIILVTTGLRAEEWQRFKKEYLKTKKVGGETLYFIYLPMEGAKWSKPRKIPVNRHVAPLLKAFPDFTVDYRKAWETAAKNAGFGKFHGRDLRHTFGTTMAPFDAFGVQLFMGHKSAGTEVSSLYQHATPERMFKFAAEVERLMPWLKRAVLKAKI